MEYFQNPQGSLFKLTRGEYDFILDMIREENPITAEASIDAYTKSNFLDEGFPRTGEGFYLRSSGII